LKQPECREIQVTHWLFNKLFNIRFGYKPSKSVCVKRLGFGYKCKIKSKNSKVLSKEWW